MAFQSFTMANVSLTGTEATVVLPGTLFGADGNAKSMTWKVLMRYDIARKEWLLPRSGM